MDQSTAHVWEILYQAARGLAISDGSLARRLRHAYTDGLHQLTADGFPWDDLREPLRDILDYFASDGADKLIIEGLTNSDQSRIASEIFDLFIKVANRER